MKILNSKLDKIKANEKKLENLILKIKIFKNNPESSNKYPTKILKTINKQIILI